MGLQEQDVDRLRQHLALAERKVEVLTNSMSEALSELDVARARLAAAQEDVHSYRRLLESAEAAE